jgi:hypothetical protein
MEDVPIILRRSHFQLLPKSIVHKPAKKVERVLRAASNFAKLERTLCALSSFIARLCLNRLGYKYIKLIRNLTMVERPIKKADRQLKPETPETTPSARQSDDSDKKRSGRDGGKGKREKRGGREEEVKAPVNLALVRGPKPTKPQPVVEEVIDEVAEASEESAPEETTEA